MFVFQTGSGRPAHGPKPDLAGLRQFSVMLGQPCERQKQLAEVVNDTRQGLQRLSGGAAFAKDEATTVAGMPAWVFQYPAKAKFTVTEVRNGKKTSHDQEEAYIVQKTLWLQNETICDMGFTAEPDGLAAMQRVSDQVQASFAWQTE